MRVAAALTAYKAQVLAQQSRGAATIRSLAILFAPVRERRLADLSTAEVRGLIDRMALGAPSHAQRAHGYARPFMKWAQGRGLVEGFPLEQLPAPRQTTRRGRVLTPAEVRAAWVAAAALGYPFGQAIGLILLTGAYRDDVGALRVSELARAKEAGWIWRPTARSPPGAPRIVPLPQAAGRLIEAALDHRKPGSDFVFSITGSTPISGWSRAKRRLDALISAGMSDSMPPWRLNDLRATFAALAADPLGIDPLVIERCLGRAIGRVGEVTQEWMESPSMIHEQRSALERYARLVASETRFGGQPIS